MFFRLNLFMIWSINWFAFPVFINQSIKFKCIANHLTLKSALLNSNQGETPPASRIRPVRNLVWWPSTVLWLIQGLLSESQTPWKTREKMIETCKSSKPELFSATTIALKITPHAIVILSCLGSQASNFFRYQMRANKLIRNRSTQMWTPLNLTLPPATASKSARRPDTSEASKACHATGLDAPYKLTLIRDKWMLATNARRKLLSRNHKEVFKSSKKYAKPSRGCLRTDTVQVAWRVMVVLRKVASKTVRQCVVRRQHLRKC